MKRFILAIFLLLLAWPAFAQDMRPVAYQGQQKKITIKGGKILGSSGGVTTIATQDVTPTVNATTYVYIDLSSTPAVATSNSGFPTASYYPICTVITDINGIITSFVDSRPDSFMAGGGGGITSGVPGPVINVTDAAYGASSTLADNATQFALAATASNAASLTAGNPAFVTVGTNQCTSACPGAAITVTVAMAAGNTACVQVSGFAPGRTFTINDGGSSYGLIATQNINTTPSVLVYCTAPGGIKQTVSSVVITDSGAAENLSAIVASFSNVGSFRFRNVQTQGSSVTPSFTDTTYDTNNLMTTWFAWYNGGASAASQNTGTLQSTTPSTVNNDGIALVTQTSATQASVVDNVTLSGSSPWVATNIELRSRTQVLPTVYVPYGKYIYSSGLNFTQPVTLKCEPGTVLYYIGTAHAVDLGPTNLAALNIMSFPYYVDGCTFAGGQTQTQGIVANVNAIVVGIRNTTFKNFGPMPYNVNAYEFEALAGNWDVEIGPQVRFHISDHQPRNLVRMNANGTDNASFLRFHDSEAFCLTSENYNAFGCDAAKTGIGIVTDGVTNRIYHNNIAFFNPMIRMLCTFGSTANPCMNNQVDQNQIEAPGTGAGTAVIQYDNQTGMLVTQNTIVMHNTTQPIGPFNGTSILRGARVNFNSVSQIPLANPIVAQNNVTGQTANFSYSNYCATDLVAFFPCALLHTAGGNINSWNADLSGTCTLVNPTGCPVVNFTQTYAIAPKCSGSWTGAGAFVGPLKVLTSTTQLTITSTTVADTGVINWICGTDSN